MGICWNNQKSCKSLRKKPSLVEHKKLFRYKSTILTHQTGTNNRRLKPMLSEKHEIWHRGSYCKDKEKEPNLRLATWMVTETGMLQIFAKLSSFFLKEAVLEYHREVFTLITSVWLVIFSWKWVPGIIFKSKNNTQMMFRLKEIPKFWKYCLFARNVGILNMTSLNIKFRFLPISDQTSSLLGWQLYTKTFLRKIILDIFLHAKLWLIPFTFILKPNFKFRHRVMTAIWELILPNFNDTFWYLLLISPY